MFRDLYIVVDTLKWLIQTVNQFHIYHRLSVTRGHFVLHLLKHVINLECNSSCYYYISCPMRDNSWCCWQQISKCHYKISSKTLIKLLYLVWMWPNLAKYHIAYVRCRQLIMSTLRACNMRNDMNMWQRHLHNHAATK